MGICFQFPQSLERIYVMFMNGHINDDLNNFEMTPLFGK